MTANLKISQNDAKDKTSAILSLQLRTYNRKKLVGGGGGYVRQWVYFFKGGLKLMVLLYKICSLTPRCTLFPLQNIQHLVL